MSRTAEGETLRGGVKSAKTRFHESGRKRLKHHTALILIAIAAIIYLIPIYWIATTSLKTSGDIHEKFQNCYCSNGR